MRNKRYIIFLITGFLLLLVSACTQYKDKYINRKYHDITARFNVYFYANDALKEGVQKLEDAYKDDYTTQLPLFMYGDKETCKAIFPEMDRVIKKASVCIQRHAIKDKKSKIELPNKGKWIDDCWNAIGKAHFYKREFFSAIEAFEYVQSVYKSKQKEEAWVWIVKSYNELNALSQSDEYITRIKNDRKFPKEYKGHFHALYAEFYIKQGNGMYENAIKQLNTAIKFTKNKNVRARYHFILGQLYEEKNNHTKAMENYKMVIKLKPAKYELFFYARMREALMNKDPESIQNARHELLKMIKDYKNNDLLDIIYFTLGQMDENENNKDAAYSNYLLSVRKSVSNTKQKTKSYLKLADISFETENYIPSSHFYDTTLTLIKEDYPGYQDIKAKKTSLDTLVKCLTIIKNQDSLQRIASMDTASMRKIIKKMIQGVIDHEQDSIAKKQQSLSAGGGTPLSPNQAFTPQMQQSGAGPGDWYFYNPNLKASGLNDFIKRWGDSRKNEDNWRRSNKTSFAIDEVSEAAKDTTKGKNKKDTVKLKSNDKHQIDYYLKNLPLTQADRDSSDKKILNAYYALGSIYKEQLYNNKKSAQTYEAMNKRFPKNTYEAPSYYQLYRIYVQQKEEQKAIDAKSFLTTNYPKSDYTKIINDPDFAKSVNAKQNEVENEYEVAYNAYENKNYTVTYTTCTDAIMKFGKNKIVPKFAYLKALASNYLYGLDSLERNMASVVVKYPSSEMFETAKATLEAIKKLKNTYSPADTLTDKDLPSTTFKVDDKAAHYCIILLNNSKDIEPIKNKVSDLNKESFSTNNYEIISMPKDDKTILAIRTFTDKDDAMGYYRFLLTKPELFTGIDKKNYSITAITTDNMGALLKSANFDEYNAFFNAKYLGIKQ
ncbi:MAG: type IX secretion system periplasmic lipoprotein PorW/SprE [Bacteroidia bacterium]